MSDQLIPITDGFWNIRGSFRVLGFVQIGTHTSLVRLGSGRYVLLDCYAFDEDILETVRGVTDGGQGIEAIINLHPFHTVHVEAVHRWFPEARLYGTGRHVEQCSGLPWQAVRAESPQMGDLFGGELRFMVPDGLDLVTDDDNVHAGSVLALHRPTRTLHVDDTLTFVNLPLVGGLRFHPMLGRALQRRAGAAADFRGWGKSLVEACAGVDHLCTAHMKSLPELKGPAAIAAAVQAALDKAQGTLDKHAAKYG